MWLLEKNHFKQIYLLMRQRTSKRTDLNLKLVTGHYKLKKDFFNLVFLEDFICRGFGEKEKIFPNIINYCDAFIRLK